MGMGKQRDLVVAKTWKRICKNLAACVLDGLQRIT